MNNNLPEDLANKKVILCKEDPFFVSPQGEGSRTGRLSTWIRTSTCNLKCSWVNPSGEVTLCDTAYTSHSPERNLKSIQEIFDNTLESAAPDCVITGGEPSSNKSLMALIDFIEDSGKRVTVETNATQFFESKATLISMSPKLSTSAAGLKAWAEGNIADDTDDFLKRLFGTQDKEKIQTKYKKFYETHEANRYNLESFKSFMDYYGPERYQFKFVINTESDVEEVIEKFQKPLNIPNANIFLMPQGCLPEQIQARAEWVIDKCKEHGFNYSDRLHIRIWGNRTGV